MTKARRVLDRAVVGLALFLLAVMTSCLFASIIVREFRLFGGSIIWAEEVSRYSLLWITFLGAAAVLERAEHIRIDFFVRLLPARVRALLDLFVDLCMAGFLVLLLIYGVSLAHKTMDHASPILGITLGYIYAIIPASAAVMTFYVACFLREDWRRLTTRGPSRGREGAP